MTSLNGLDTSEDLVFMKQDVKKKKPLKTREYDHSKSIALLKLLDSGGIEVSEIATVEQCFSFTSF